MGLAQIAVPMVEDCAGMDQSLHCNQQGHMVICVKHYNIQCVDSVN